MLPYTLLCLRSVSEKLTYRKHLVLSTDSLKHNLETFLLAHY